MRWRTPQPTVAVAELFFLSFSFLVSLILFLIFEEFIIRDENKKDPVLTVHNREYEITQFNNLYTKEVKVQDHGEMYLCNLGFPVLSIRSMHKQADWDEAQRKFNDLDEPSEC